MQAGGPEHPEQNEERTDAGAPEAAERPEGSTGSTVETHSSDQAAAGEGAAAPGSVAPSSGADPTRLRWYAVNTYSGHENKARLALLERIRKAEMEGRFGEVLVPTESVVEMVKGQRRTMTRKLHPGYMYIQMVLDDGTFHLVRNTPKITGFLGGNKPLPVRDEEIAGINRQMTEGASKPKPKVSFEEGETIRVTGGPFANFSGVVQEVRPEKQKVRVLVSIFGRATPVDLDFVEVEKA